MPERDDPKRGEPRGGSQPEPRGDDTPTAREPSPPASSSAAAEKRAGEAQPAPIAPQRFAPPRPERIGPYRIVSEIGDGGMGVVYLALREDETFQRRVAIKVVKRGMDTAEVLRRFDLERQVLATLNHPNIARLIDGGATDDGLPYFVMEHVEGRPITDHCDTHRLTVDERLALFRTVCGAVHYAHQNLIVHRDLKPANILVTADGVPKLLDFGIAKLLNPDIAARLIDPTGSGLRLMTPEYASPEQARGDPITTASDVYTLGVLLYELLTGHRPYRLKSRIQQELVQVICEEEPERPSTAVSRVEEVPDPTPVREGGLPSTRTITPDGVSKARESRPDRLRRRLEGDLDNIVLMAMRKEPQRRYLGALELAEDIGRHLSNHPVVARPDSPVYRAGKFVRRNRGTVAATTFVAIALIAGICAAVWGANAARRQADRAERALIATSRLGEVMDGFSRSLESFRSSTKRREQLAEQTLAALRTLEAEVEVSPSVRRAVARAYVRLGDLQGGVRGPSGGDTDAALESYQKAAALLKSTDVAGPSLSDGLTCSTVLLRVGDAQKATDSALALESYREALAIAKRLYDAGEHGPEVRRTLALAMINVGDINSKMKQFDEAERLFADSLALRRELLAEAGDDVSARRDVFTGLSRMVGVHERAGRLSGALAVAQESNQLRVANLKEESDLPRAQRDLMTGLMKESSILSALGRAGEARGALERAAETAQQLADADTTDVRAVRDLVSVYEALGDAADDLKDREAAAAAYATMRGAADKLAVMGNKSATQFQASANARLGNVRLFAGDASGALQSYQASLDLYARKASEDKSNLDWALNVVIMHGAVGDAYSALGEPEHAESAYAAALTKLDEIAKGAKDPTQFRAAEASARWRRARSLLDLDRAADAQEEAMAAVALLDTEKTSAPLTKSERGGLASALATLVLARVASQSSADVVPLAERAVALSERKDAFALRALARARFASADVVRAIESANEAIALVRDAKGSSPDVRLRARVEVDLVEFQGAPSSR